MTSFTETIQSAFANFQSGNLPEAERICRRILSQDSTQPEALHLLGVICHGLRKHQMATKYLSEAIARNPSEPSYHSNFGAILHALGRPTEARDCFREAVALKPDLTDAHYNLGLALYDLEHYEEATQSFQKALQLNSNYAQAHNNLGMIHKRRSRLHQALECFLAAIRSNPRLAEAHYNAGLVYMEQGLFPQAISHFQHTVRLQPANAEAHCNLGCAFQKVDKIRDSIASLKAALRHNANYAKAHNHLGISLRVVGRVTEAIESYRQAIRLKPDYAEAYANLGLALEAQGQLDDAASSYRKAIELAPDDPDAAAGFASVCDKQRRFEQAYSVLRPFLEAPTANINVACVFANLAPRLARQQEAIALLEHILATQRLPVYRGKMIHFSLGSLYDGMQLYDRAFAQYKKANDLFSGRFDTEKFKLAIDELIQVYSKDNIERYPRNSRASQRPVFIVGMPRSGTSLVEQILASHPRVYGAGELEEIQHIVSSLPNVLESTERYPLCMSQLSRVAVETLAERYWDSLIRRAPEAARITDKMPENFFHLGLISQLFPKAAVIHCTRNPLDTCLSAYFQIFARGHEYSYNLETLGLYYLQYERLMRHWQEVLDIAILDVSYEDLVSESEEVARRMIGFCGLEWDEKCMRFYDTERPVATASYEQVQRPIYKSSLGRSKHYERYLGPLVAILRLCS